MCGSCKGEGFVMKHKKLVKAYDVVNVYNVGTDTVELCKIPKLIEVGGIDACKRCAQKAEAAYQVLLIGRLNTAQNGRKFDSVRFMTNYRALCQI